MIINFNEGKNHRKHQNIGWSSSQGHRTIIAYIIEVIIELYKFTAKTSIVEQSKTEC